MVEQLNRRRTRSSSSLDRLADLRKRADTARRLRQKRLADDASAQAEKEFRFRVSQQNIAPAQTAAPQGTIFGKTIGKIIPDPIEKPISDSLKLGYNVGFKVLPELFYAGATGLAPGISGGEKAQRVRQRWGEYTNRDKNIREGKDNEGLADMFSDIKDIHEERPWWGQIGVSFFNPLEYAAGAAISKGVKAMSLGAKAARVGKTIPKVAKVPEVLHGVAKVVIPKLQTTDEYVARAIPTYSPSKGKGNEIVESTKGKFNLREHYRNVKSFLHEHIGLNALADPTNKGFQYRAASDMMQAGVNDNVVLLMNKINAKGDVRLLFSLDDEFATTLGGKIQRTSFQEIAQKSKTKYANVLTSEQRGWLSNFSDVTQSVKQYVLDEDAFRGKDADKWLFNKGIEGDYFPNFWGFMQKFDEKIMLKGGGKVKKFVGAKGPDEHTRFHRDALDAFEKGYRGDPLEQVATLYQSMYKRVMDKKLTDMARPWMKSMQERMGVGYDDAIKRQTGIIKGLQSIDDSNFLNGLLDVRKTKKLLGMFKGKTSVLRSNPEIIAKMKKIRVMGAGAEKKAAIESLKKDIKVAVVKAKSKMNAKGTGLRDRIKARKSSREKRPGEMTFPMSAYSGKIGTPKELFDQVDNLGFAKLLGDTGSVDNLTRKEWDIFSKVVNNTESGGKVLKMVEGSQATVRTLMTGFDLGLYALHLMPMALTNPKSFAKVFKKSIQATVGGDVDIGLSGKFGFKKGNVLAKYLDDNWDTVIDMNNHGLGHGSMSDFVQGLGKGTPLRRLAATKPGGRQVLKPMEKLLEGVERNFESGLTMAKVELWKSLKPLALKSAKTPEAQREALHKLGSHIRKMTGTASMEEIGLTPGTQRALGAFLMFAPRYRLATYGLMKDVFRGGLEGSLARESMGRIAGAGMMYYSYIGHHLGQDPILDPTDGRFMTYQFGDSRIGIGTAFISTARFMARFTKESIENPGKQVPWKVFDSDNQLGNFMRGQLAPLTGTGWDMIEGRDFIGEPTRDDFGSMFENAIAENVMPFWMSGIIFDVPRAGWGSIPAEFLGGRTQPVSQWERYKYAFDVEALQDKELNPNGLSYNEMNRLQRAKIMKKYPALQKLKDQSYEISSLRERSDEISTYRERSKVAKDNYDADMNKLLELFKMGKMRGKTFREERSLLGASMGFEYELIEEEYEDIIKAIDEERQNPLAHIEDLAFDDYMKRVVDGDFYNEDEGEFDFAAKRAAEESFKEDWGESNFAYVKQRMMQNKPTELQELDLGREAIGPYWEVGNIILDRLGHGNLKGEYNRYLKSRKAERELMELEYPMFKEVKSAQAKAREAMRIKNPKLEQFLYRWDYIDTFLNPNNISQYSTYEEIQELKGTQIWFDNMPNIDEQV